MMARRRPKTMPLYTKGDFNNDLLDMKHELLEKTESSDMAKWTIRVLDRTLASLYYSYSFPTELMPSCETRLDIGFSKLYSLYLDPNNIPFPLPGDVSPSELSRDVATTSLDWLCGHNEVTNWEFQNEDEGFTRWSSNNPMSKYYVRPDRHLSNRTLGSPSPCPADEETSIYFAKTLRPETHCGLTALRTQITGEAAWVVFKPGLVLREVMTSEQTLTWETRQKRERLTEREMARRRRHIARYFARTYGYSEQTMEPFMGFAERMKRNAKQISSLC